jgi:acyl-CoA synthetase (NDP forming)/GNAT superfamily N-acetyltransferase
VDYPHELERQGLLRDGRSVLIRPIRPDDLDLLFDFSRRLSRQTVSYRLLGPVIRLNRTDLRPYVDIDYDQQLTLVAVLGERIIANARAIRDPDDPTVAEMTFTIEDAWQGHGLGGLLLEHLAAAMRERGVHTFHADILPQNSRMLRAITGSGYQYRMNTNGSVVDVDLAIDPRDQVLRRSERRLQRAVRSSLRPLFHPRSVAVVGASEKGDTLGANVLANLQSAAHDCPIHAINLDPSSVTSVPSYSRLGDVPGPVDLVLVAVNASAVPGVLNECGEVGATAVVVFSASATSPSGGQPFAEQTAEIARRSGFRLVGPESMGILSSTAQSKLAATFARVLPDRGVVSMSSQSGPIGLAVLDLAARLGLGMASFVSIGSGSDVTSNDLMQWWEEDPATSVVLLHTEHFGNPHRFSQIARRVAARKPIIAVHPSAGQRPASAEGAARNEAAVSTLFAQSGVIRAHTLEQLFDVALLLAHQPVPAGNRVAIITNASGPGTLTASTAQYNGLRSAELAPETAATIAAVNPGCTSPSGAIDLTPWAGADEYREVLDAVLADDGVDSVIVQFVPPLTRNAEAIAEAIVSACVGTHKTIAASFLAQAGVSAVLRREEYCIPSYPFPESAAIAIGRAAAYGAWQREPVGIVDRPDTVDVECARGIVDSHPDHVMTAESAIQLLACFGIPSGAEAGVAAPAGASAEADRFRDLVLRVEQDPIFGSVMSLRLQDPLAELLGDTAFRVVPVSDRDAARMVTSLRAHRLLEAGGYHLPALEDLIVRISLLIEACPQVHELELAPVRLRHDEPHVVIGGGTLRLGEPDPHRQPLEASVAPIL